MTERWWFAVRTVVCTPAERALGPQDLEPGGRAYEERITLWHGVDADSAIMSAEDEARAYAEGVGAELLNFSQSYHLFDTPGEASEVFSLIRSSRLDHHAYLDAHFDTGSEYQAEIR